MAALKDCDLGEFLPRLEAELKSKHTELQNLGKQTANHHIEYNEIQCDKRNAYRRKVKEDKAAAAPQENGENAEALPGVPGAGATNGDPILLIDPSSDAAERPAKKQKRETGESAQLDDEEADDADDAENDDTEMNQEVEEQDEEVEEDDVDDEEASDGSDNDVMEDAREELEEARGELKDEALDEPDSD